MRTAAAASTDRAVSAGVRYLDVLADEVERLGTELLRVPVVDGRDACSNRARCSGVSAMISIAGLSEGLEVLGLGS